MSPSVPDVVLLRFDGIVHTSDLPTQAFARHLSEQLSGEQVPVLIGGMRGFLEGKADLIPPGIDLTDAEDGDEAVEVLARTMGVEQRAIDDARSASRRDLAASVWAVDRADGLDELLGALRPATVVVVATPNDPAATALLDSEEISVDELLQAPFAAALRQLRNRVEGSAAVVAISTRWAGELSVAQAEGCVTVLVDRRGSGRGTPTIRSPDLCGVGPRLAALRAGEQQPQTTTAT